ncbi:rod shape-determining protein MreD [Acetonema longum]|uniref:Uncharacterized protein n=1 Tax=Acetonema longum DSM 6540 TaxID=1009370 RepID=F7NHP0_9FIRM|nr:rod shape-determining protein MreD [Acetonema longum]EGO64415.1 hypothetical protein ALO_07938 [Acetonema longum DSM 6540]
MKALQWILLLLVTVVVQATVVPFVLPFVVRPDLLLVIVVSTGFLCGKERAVGIGFFAGLLQDLATGNLFGIHILSKMAVGYIAGSAERQIFKENLFLPVAGMFIFTLIHGFIALSLLALLGYKAEWLATAFYQLVPMIMYNMAFSIPVHQVVYRLLALEK